MEQRSLFGLSEHLERISKIGDLLEHDVLPSEHIMLYRSRRNEKWLASKRLVGRIHRRKPAGKPLPQNIARANAAKSSIRAAVEHVFAHQKNRFGLFIRTIGIARAEAKLILANIAYNFDWLIFHERARAAG